MIVLDTQAWLWWMHSPQTLSDAARTAVEDAEATSRILVSAISVWEVAVKVDLGKLTLPMAIDDWYEKASSYPRIAVEPLSPRDAIASTQLPGTFHRDPADRIIVAFALRHGAPLVTSDRRIRDYAHVPTIW
ncbi:MAG: type II toxin-antitoxin system VapC family toxin [Coriobacteriia bacterium]|nr:type II toxin-antitoxin system VapC family toxin [Coriobacteriia bacterium]